MWRCQWILDGVKSTLGRRGHHRSYPQSSDPGPRKQGRVRIIFSRIRSGNMWYRVISHSRCRRKMRVRECEMWHLEENDMYCLCFDLQLLISCWHITQPVLFSVRIVSCLSVYHFTQTSPDWVCLLWAPFQIWYLLVLWTDAVGFG